MPTPSPNNKPSADPEAIYAAVMKKIAETDKISFQLLGLVPLVSGGALVALLSKVINLSFPASVVVGLLGAAITYFIGGMDNEKKEDTYGSKV